MNNMNMLDLGDLLSDVESGGFWRGLVASVRLWWNYGSVDEAEDAYEEMLRRSRVVKKPTFVEQERAREIVDKNKFNGTVRGRFVPTGTITGRHSTSAPVIEEVEKRQDDDGMGLVEGVLIGSLIANALDSNDNTAPTTSNDNSWGGFSGGGDFGGGGTGGTWS